MSVSSRSEFYYPSNFTYGNIQNDASEDEVPHLVEQVSTSDLQRHRIEFSDQNKAGITTEKTTNIKKKTVNRSKSNEQKRSDSKMKKTEKFKSIENRRSNPLSFVGKILLCISLLILIGGIFLAKLQENLSKPPETEDSKRALKIAVFNQHRQNLKIQNLKSHLNIEKKDELEEELTQTRIQKLEKKTEIPQKKKILDSIDQTQINTQKVLIQVKTKTIQNQKDQMNKFSENEKKISNQIFQKSPQATQSLEMNSKDVGEKPLISSRQGQKTQNPETSTKGSILLPQNQIEAPSVADTLNWKKPQTEQNMNELQRQTTSKPQSIEDPIMMMSCSDYIQSLQQKYGRLYTFNSQRQFFRSNSGADNFAENYAIKINNVKYTQAVDLLDVIHKINQKGEINVKNNPCQNSDVAAKRIDQTTHKQFERLNELYQIDHYHQHQLRFCIVTNSFKNAENGLFYRNIDSILQQNYSNYHVVYTDDNSPDNTGQVVRNYLTEKGVEEGKFKVKINSDKKGMMENIFNAITQDCELGEIAVMLDGDDSFIGTNVLSLLNAVYQKEKMALIWNNFIEITDNNRALMGFSRDYIKEQQTISQRRAIKFVSSHLKSFYVDLFRKIKVEDLQENNGNFFGGASDTAMMIPMIEMAQRKYMYLPEITYEYRYDTGQVGMVVNRVAQRTALSKLQVSKPYQSLVDFSFIDEAIKRVEKA